MPLTSASDIKSWTARSPTASAPHSHALNRPREDQLSPVWPPPVRSPLPAASSSNPSRTPARNGRTAREQRAQGVQLPPPADEDVGTGVCGYALPPVSWRPPPPQGTSTPAASSPTVWRSMRPVRGERQGDDAHAVCDVTSPARSVWSLRRFLLPSWSPSLSLRVATEQGLCVEAARAEESGREQAPSA